MILDPVDPKRNLGAAISPRSVGRLVLAARAFLKSPSLRYFKPIQRTGIDHIEDSPLLPYLAAVVFRHRMRTVDDLWGQLKRSVRRVEMQLGKKGFRVLMARAASDEENNSAFVFLLESLALPKFELRSGPKATMGEATSRFLTKRRADSLLTWVGDDLRTQTVILRASPDLKKFLVELVSRRLDASGVSRGLQPDLKKEARIITGRQVLKAATKFRWLEATVVSMLAGDPVLQG
jgi:tRNA nucleotidyltransferase (CCA-adding enzyme)